MHVAAAAREPYHSNGGKRYSGYRGHTYRNHWSHGTMGPMHIGPKLPQRVVNSALPKTRKTLLYQWFKSWRWTQSRANPSLAKFPDNPRFTGKKHEITGNSYLRTGYSHAFSIGYGRIPYAMEQGILSREQGVHFLDQGIAQWFGCRFNARARNHRILNIPIMTYAGAHNAQHCGLMPASTATQCPRPHAAEVPFGVGINDSAA